MGLEKLLVTLDNQSSTFFPGHTISGKISLTIKNEPLRLKGINT